MMDLPTVHPLVAAILARLRVVEEGLHSLGPAMQHDDRTTVLGGLAMAQDHLGPLSTLIDAAILLLKAP